MLPKAIPMSSEIGVEVWRSPGLLTVHTHEIAQSEARVSHWSGNYKYSQACARWGLIDTGATTSCIDDQLAQQLGLPVIDKVTKLLF
jgi:hypothetical protein